MAKINIAGVKRGEANHQVHIVLTEQQEIEGEMRDVPLGEAFITFAEGTTPANAKKEIVKASQGILQKSKEAKVIREKLEKVEWPEIT